MSELKEKDILGVSSPTTGACGHSSILSESQYAHTTHATSDCGTPSTGIADLYKVKKMFEESC